MMEFRDKNDKVKFILEDNGDITILDEDQEKEEETE